MKPIYKTKTFWINVIMAVISLATGLEAIEGVTFPAWVMPVVILVSNVALRLVTNEPASVTGKE